MLKKLPEYSEASIVRSRNDNTLKSCDIVVDVGGVYDPNTHRYDHHQRYMWVYLMRNLMRTGHLFTAISKSGRLTNWDTSLIRTLH